MKRTILILAAAPLVLVAITWAAMLVFDRPSVEAPSWLEATSTLAAFVAAAVAIRYAHEAYQIEARRDERWAMERRSAQASLVAAWLAEDKDGVAGYWLRNASQLPVTEVDLILMLNSSEVGRPMHLSVVAPRPEPVFVEWPEGLQEEMQEIRDDLDLEDDHPPDVLLMFSDSALVRWGRRYGELVEIDLDTVWPDDL